MRGLEGKVAIVTGGGQGIGRALSSRLAEEGAKVAIFDLKPEAGEETAGLAGAGAKVKTYQVDVGDQDAVNAAVDRVEAELGPVWALVNSGISQMALNAVKLFYHTAESKEGVNAFTEKRKPDFHKCVK